MLVVRYRKRRGAKEEVKEREKAGGIMKGAHMWLLRGRSKKALHRIKQPLKSQSIQIPKKQHLTATPVSACNHTVLPHRPIMLLLCCRGPAITHG